MEVDSAEVESGVFGASTHAAVSAFNERRVGLRDASHCDEATWYVPPSTPEWPFGTPPSHLRLCELGTTFQQRDRSGSPY